MPQDQGKDQKPEQPRSKPEIIPPEKGDGKEKPQIFIWVAGQDGRMTLARPSPFSILLALAIFALVATVVLIVLLGAVLLWLPFIVLAVAGLLLIALVRNYWSRFRRWFG